MKPTVGTHTRARFDVFARRDRTNPYQHHERVRCASTLPAGGKVEPIFGAMVTRTQTCRLEALAQQRQTAPRGGLNRPEAFTLSSKPRQQRNRTERAGWILCVRIFARAFGRCRLSIEFWPPAETRNIPPDFSFNTSTRDKRWRIKFLALLQPSTLEVDSSPGCHG